MASDEEEFQAFMSALNAPVKDMGPGARRAAAGMPPAPSTADANPSPMDYGTDILGRKRTQPSKLGNTHDPMEADTGAQMIAGGLMGYGAGAAVAPTAGALFPNALARVVTGATEGAVASKTQGGRADVGALIGGGLGALGAAGAGRAARADKDLYREIGRAGTQKTQGKLTELGADQIVKTAREFDIMKSPSWKDRAAASGAAKQQVGEQIGGVFKTLDGAGAARPTGSVVEALENLKGELGKSTEGAKLAEIVTAKQQELLKLYPQNVPASALNKEIGDLQAIGYSGSGVGQLSPVAAKRVARMSAKALDGELDTALAAARKDPNLAKAVESLDQLNPTYRSLIAIDTIAKRQAATEPFKKTMGEQFMAAPGKTSMQLATKAATAPMRFGAQQLEAAGAGMPTGGPAAAAGAVGRPERKVAPAVVPIVQSLSEHNGADLSKHVEAAVFGP